MAIIDWVTWHGVTRGQGSDDPGGLSWIARAARGALVAFASLPMGCTATVDARPSAPPEATGSVVMDWTIDGTKDPNQCSASGAPTFNVSLYGSNGVLAGQWVQDCAALSTTVGGLLSDTYTGHADLVDPGGRPRTTSVPLAPFDVVPGAQGTVLVDFPADSFF